MAGKLLGSLAGLRGLQASMPLLDCDATGWLVGELLF